MSTELRQEKKDIKAKKRAKFREEVADIYADFASDSNLPANAKVLLEESGLSRMESLGNLANANRPDLRNTNPWAAARTNVTGPSFPRRLLEHFWQTCFDGCDDADKIKELIDGHVAWKNLLRLRVKGAGNWASECPLSFRDGDFGDIATMFIEVAVHAAALVDEMNAELEAVEQKRQPTMDRKKTIGTRIGEPSGVPVSNITAQSRLTDEALSNIVNQISSFSIPPSLTSRLDKEEEELDAIIVDNIRCWVYKTDYTVDINAIQRETASSDQARPLGQLHLAPQIRCKCKKVIRLQLQKSTKETSVSLSGFRYHVLGRAGKDGYPRKCPWAIELKPAIVQPQAAAKPTKTKRKDSDIDSDTSTYSPEKRRGAGA